jgi:hypothetical protein
MFARLKDLLKSFSAILCFLSFTVFMPQWSAYFFLAINVQVSMVSLAPVIQRNSNLKCLKTAGCSSLQFKRDEVEPVSDSGYGDFVHEIKSTCYLEDIEMGWGFCPILIEDLIPSFSEVRKMTVGLGTTLAETILHALPEICPFLESLVLRFQVCSSHYCILYKNVCL